MQDRVRVRFGDESADLAPCPANLLWYPLVHDLRRRERPPVFPYLAMLAAPGFFALTGVRRAGVTLLAIAVFYWLMIGFRFQVGADSFYCSDRTARRRGCPSSRERDACL